MSLERFEKCLAVTLQFEGGYSDDPDDAGGATNLGIEYQEWLAWQREQGKPTSTLHDFATMLTPADVQPLYLEKYWIPATQGGTLPAPLDMVVFDTSVLEGLGKAQEFLSLTQSFTDPTARALAIQGERAAHFHSIVNANPSQQKFLAGWLSRVNQLTALIHQGKI